MYLFLLVVVVVYVNAGGGSDVVRVGDKSVLLGCGSVWGSGTGLRVFAFVGAMGELDGPLASFLPFMRWTTILCSFERTTEVRFPRRSSPSASSRSRKRS